MAGRPAVSAIIIFLDAEAFLEEAIASIFAQSYRDWELILVDDGSTDGSTATARKYATENAGRVRYFEHPGHRNLGMSASRNLGIAHARGKYVAFVDADDVWLPHKLAFQSSILDSTPAAGMVFGPTIFWFSWTGDQDDGERDFTTELPEKPETLIGPPQFLKGLLREAPPATICSLLVRRELVLRLGGFESRFRGLFEDAVFLAKVYLDAAVYVSSECTAKYRMRQDSCVFTALETHRYHAGRLVFLEWLKRYLDEKSLEDTQVRRALQTALFPYDHPVLDKAARHVKRVMARAVERVEDVQLAAWKLSRRNAITGRLTASPNPLRLRDPFAARFANGRIQLDWSAAGIDVVEVRVDAPDGPLVTRGGPTGSFITGRWVRDGMRFYLQDVSEDKALVKRYTLDRIRVVVVREQPAKPSAQTTTALIVADPNPICLTEPTGDTIPVGSTTLSWECGGVDTVEVRIDAPDGPLFSRKPGAGKAVTGSWVRDGMQFFLQDVSGGKTLTSEHTLATVRIHVRPSILKSPVTGAVLLYHRIAECDCDPWSLCVSPKHFKEHLETIRSFDCAIRPGKIADSHEPRIAVTFDDGYAETVQHAERLLSRYEIPATIFVVSDFLEQGREFWWDELEQIFLTPGLLPPLLRLNVGRSTCEEYLGPDTAYDGAALRSNRSWRAWSETTPTARHGAYRRLHQRLKPLTDAEREPLIQQLFAWAGRDRAIRDSHRSISSQQLSEIATNSLIEIGTHTRTHPFLPVLSTSRQLDEIQGSKQSLEERLCRPVCGLSYPYGSFSADTVAVTKAAGLKYACSTIPDVVRRGSDRCQLPRLVVEDWNGDEFAQHLRSWLGGDTGGYT